MKKYFEILGILIVLALCGFGFYAANYNPNPELDEKSNKRQYLYLDSAVVHSGFYNGFVCLVLREYEKSIFCKIVARDGYEMFGGISDDLRINVNIRKSDVTRRE